MFTRKHTLFVQHNLGILFRQMNKLKLFEMCTLCAPDPVRHVLCQHRNYSSRTRSEIESESTRAPGRWPTMDTL